MSIAERRLREETIAELRRNVDADEVEVRRSADLRYAGQNYELEVSLPEGDLDDDRWQELLGRFEAEHERQYGFPPRRRGRDDQPPRDGAPTRGAGKARRGSGGYAEPGSREVWFDAEAPVYCPIYRRDGLAPGVVLQGPAVIQESDSTTLVFDGDRLIVHPSGVLILTIGAPA